MINDFGEKIGGARKDVWKERGLMVEDLNGMTQGEKEKFELKVRAYKNWIYDNRNRPMRESLNEKVNSTF